MAELTAEQFAQRAFDMNLLDERQLEAIWADFRRRDVPLEEFHKLVLRRDLLTNYQVERLLRGERTGYFYGNYKVQYLVGTGTFARVFRAVHKETGRVVGLKVLRRRFSDDPEKTEQFLREGEMGTRLRHPNVVPIYEVISERGQHVLVLEFVEGRSLRDFLKIRGRLEPLEAVRLITDVVAGLAHAFERGITHRDMKLSNVLIAANGRAKLVDFGLAAEDTSMSDEALANCVNPRTIDYAGLERATGVRKDDRRSDIYFVGCIFYHMLASEAPLHETTDRLQRLSVHRFEEVRPITELIPDLPAPVTMIVNKSMELNPDRRYETPAAMLADLQQCKAKVEAGDLRAAGAHLAGAPEGTDRTVLIVETNLEMQDVFRKQLKKHGYRVLVFSDPQRALTRFEKDEQRPADCVVFCTSELGISALEVFNRFNDYAQTKDVPCILLLDKRQAALKDKAEVNDHRVVVSMPVRLKQFRAVLAKLLQTPASSS